MAPPAALEAALCRTRLAIVVAEFVLDAVDMLLKILDIIGVLFAAQQA
jgi:hypothetical protein